MGRKIIIIQGHPDDSQQHFCHALAAAYEKGARAAGHEVRSISVAELDFPLLRTFDDYYHQAAPPVMQRCRTICVGPSIWCSFILYGWVACLHY